MDDTVMISVFMALEGVHAYSAFLPSVFTIKTFVKDNDAKRMIREGEFWASGFLVGLAFVTAKISRSWWPFVMAIISGGIMVGVYEYALYRAPVNDASNDGDDWEG